MTDLNTIVEFLTGVIDNRHRSPEEKERAATALKFYAVKEAEANLERPGVAFTDRSSFLLRDCRKDRENVSL